MTNPPNNLQPAIQQVYADHRRIVKEKSRQINALQAEKGELQRALQERPETPSETLTERAEKAERALAEMTALRDKSRDIAFKWQMAANRVRGERDKATAELFAERPRPLSPDAITEDMIERARKAYRSAPWNTDAFRAVLVAALTVPPKRPEGAESIEAILSELPDTELPITDAGRADLLAERGVRASHE